ncbi:MAG TPA: hypothetical protein VFL62_08835 [Bradyrhizobium sp.]|uniref:hypothetical protein n=1 Tax=Bradyrhizobium sp. TaxID=376 RepID=UPI002D802C91|nr:hypothetical protein [Bradyrhizobium sp.]HET7886315.1 hypothetical protein [Bradyrhizobium sp.]
MLNSETTALLRALLQEICEEVGQYENGTRAHVAAKLLEAAARGEQTIENLKATGREALRRTPTMWR